MSGFAPGEIAALTKLMLRLHDALEREEEAALAGCAKTVRFSGARGRRNEGS